MKQDQVQIGGVYMAKVTHRSVEVRIDRQNPRGGWDATSLQTNKKIRVKSAQRLSIARGGERRVVDEEIQEPEMEAPEVEVAEEPATAPPAPAKPVLTEAIVSEPVVVADAGTHKRGRKGSPRNAPKTTVARPAAADKPAKAMGCLDAAAAVLKEAAAPMRCQEMITAMKERGLWTSNAPTPHATLYSAILREITTKGAASRFKKTERGTFTLSA